MRYVAKGLSITQNRREKKRQKSINTNKNMAISIIVGMKFIQNLVNHGIRDGNKHQPIHNGKLEPQFCGKKCAEL